MDQYYALIRETIARCGLFLQAVGGDARNSGFTYTIGNREKGYPEFIIALSLSQDAGNRTLNYIRHRLDEGDKIELGRNTDLFRVPCEIVECKEWVKTERAIQNGRYYDKDQDYKLWQLVLSDPHGRLPGEIGCQEPYASQEQFGLAQKGAKSSHEV